jgi:hypothetical protein
MTNDLQYQHQGNQAPAAPAADTDPEPRRGRADDAPYIKVRLDSDHAAWEQRQKDKAQRAQEAAALRAELQKKQQNRLAREAIAGLSEADRAAFDKLTDPEVHVSRMVQDARAQVEAETIQAIEARKQQEYAEWRTKHQKASPFELYKALEEIKGRAEASKQAFFTARQERELQAEIHDDPITRALAVLDDAGVKLFAKSFEAWRSRDPMADVRAAKKAVINTELRKQYEKEMMEARTVDWKYNVRTKYRGLGLDV